MANTVWEVRTDEWAFNGPASTPEKMRYNVAKASEDTNRPHINTDYKESHRNDTSLLSSRDH